MSRFRNLREREPAYLLSLIHIFNLPAQAVPGQFADQRKIVKVSTDRVQIDAVKKAEDEDCLIVRLHECRGGRGKVKLSSEFPVKKLVSCNPVSYTHLVISWI